MSESFNGEPPDAQLTEAQKERVAALSREQIAAIDEALLSKTDNNFRKVAFVVGITMSDLPDRIEGIPDTYYAQRVRALVESGVLEYQGHLDRMRWCEIRRTSNPDG